MKCLFCHHEILKDNDFLGKPITLPARGIAHTMCAERDLISRRVFGSIHLTELTMDDLYELREMVLSEINDRVVDDKDKEPELF